MSSETFLSGGNKYKITVYPAPPDGKRHPVILLVHGNSGLGGTYGDQIHSFAKNLASRGYLTAVPQYYQDDKPHLADTVPHVQTLADAITAAVNRPEADPGRVGLIGYSLGAATALTFIASNPKGTVKVLADYFGFLTASIPGGISKFPPTIIFHNENDQIVPVKNSKDLDKLFPATIDHTFVPYDEQWMEVNHAFKPDGFADIDSRSKTADWFIKYLPPTGN